MATITISNLSMAGSDLFSDTESYLNEVSNDDLLMVNGGITPYVISAGISLVVGISVSYAQTPGFNKNKK